MGADVQAAMQQMQANPGVMREMQQLMSDPEALKEVMNDPKVRRSDLQSQRSDEGAAMTFDEVNYKSADLMYKTSGILLKLTKQSLPPS